MRIVPDTNLIISGLLWRGNPRRIINLAQAKEIELYGSGETYSEFRRVAEYTRFQKYLEREIFSPQKLIVDYRAFIKPVSVAGILPGISVVKDDPDDDAFFRVAKACGAKLIISGDPHLLKIKKYDDIRVVEPTIFLEIYPKLRGNRVG